jgi:hypothetical protein
MGKNKEGKLVKRLKLVSGRNYQKGIGTSTYQAEF